MDDRLALLTRVRADAVAVAEVGSGISKRDHWRHGSQPEHEQAGSEFGNHPGADVVRAAGTGRALGRAARGGLFIRRRCCSIG
jgi:hypothetical protein